MNQIFGASIQTVLLMSLVILANTQRPASNYRDVGVHELERQNKITKQILEAFIQKKLGLKNNGYRPPSVFEILPMPAIITTKKPEPVDDAEPEEDSEEDVQDQDTPENKETLEYNDNESLQSVESEQIDSIYNTEGRTKKYASGAPFEADLEPSSYNSKL